jgi:sarcosine oxidase delta subunit
MTFKREIIIQNIDNMDQAYRDMNVWCEKNIKGLYEVWQGEGDMYVYFNSDRDAVTFSLRFA